MTRRRKSPILAAGCLALSLACSSTPQRTPSATAPPSGEASEGSPVARRVLVIGLDAADEQMIIPLARAGRLPVLAGFYRDGATGPLQSHKPMLSPILWTSIATGVSPERHGILDFIETGPDGVSPIGSSQRRAATFWEVLGGAGVKVGVVGWLATFPATAVNGWLVSDRLTIHPYETVDSEPRADPAGKTYPAAMIEEISRLVIRPEDVSPQELASDFGLSPGRGGPAGVSAPRGAEDPDERALRVISAATRTHANVALYLASERTPGLLAVYFDGLDRLLHLFSDVSPSPMTGADLRRAERYRGVVESFYSVMDRVIGELVQAAGPGATVILVSDHGWKSGRDRPASDPRREGPHGADWHHDFGVILARGSGVRAQSRIEGADIYDVAPTLLAIYGVPAARDFQGKRLDSIFAPGFLPSSPAPVASYPRAARPGTTPGDVARGSSRAVPGEEERRAALRNLETLGYVRGGGAMGAAAGSAPAADRSRANLATVYLEEKRYREAASMYEEFLRTSPGDYDVLYNLAFARRELGDQAGARKAYRDAARARPSTAEPWVGLGELEMRARRWVEARQALETALKLSPADATAWNYLGTVMCDLNRIGEGVKCFQKAIELQPGRPSPYLNLARVLDYMGRRGEAIAVVRRGLAVMPRDERLQRRLAELGKPS